LKKKNYCCDIKAEFTASLFQSLCHDPSEINSNMMTNIESNCAKTMIDFLDCLMN